VVAGDRRAVFAPGLYNQPDHVVQRTYCHPIRPSMAHARPEYAITLAIVGVFLAIGIPSLRRGHVVVGWICVGLAVVVAMWAIRALVRDRG